MNGQQYITTQMRLIEIGRIAQNLDLDGFVKSIENAETAGAAMDPEQYKKSALALDAAKRLAQSVQPVKVVYAETFQNIMKTSAVGFVKDTEKNKNA